MNADEIIRQFSAESGFPYDTARQRALILDALHSVLVSELIPVMPNGGLRQPWEFKLEPPVVITATTGSPALFNTYVGDFFTLICPASRLTTTFDAPTMRGRWLRLKFTDDTWVTVRLRDTFEFESDANQQDGYKSVTVRALVLDQPMQQASTGIEVTIFTLDYPIPGDVTKVGTVRRYELNSDEHTVLRAAFSRDVAERYKAGQLITGPPGEVGWGQDLKVPTPHETPTVSATETVIGPSALKWGYDDSAVEQTKYGPAGTFSYCYCLVWGRRPWLHPAKGWGDLAPFLMSAPTLPTSQVTTTWAGSRIILRSADMDYVLGLGQDSTLPSYHRNGLEKWWFRARHAAESISSANNHSQFKNVESDGTYYLWHIEDASVTTTYDKGWYDPVDRSVALHDLHGHRSLRFDMLPSQVATIGVDLTRRPEKITSLSDVPELPVEAAAVIINRLRKRLVANRRGDMAMAAQLDAEYVGLLRTFLGAVSSDPLLDLGAMTMGPPSLVRRKELINWTEPV